MKKVLLTALILAALLFTGLAYAQKVVTYTLVPVTSAELKEVIILADENGAMSAVVTYRVLDDQGNIREEGGAISFDLSTADKAQLNGFINATVLPNINTSEGL